MHRHMMKSKIHRAKVTQADLHYEGSLTVDQTLMDAAQMIPYEMIKVYNVDNGERFETYVIPGPADSGVICLNGAAARKGHVGDLLIIVTSAWMGEEEAAAHEPVVVLVDAGNRIKKESKSETAFLKVAQ